MSGLPSSGFNKWRCLVALAYVDNVFTDEERKFITSRLDAHEGKHMSEEQRKTIEADFESPPPLEECFNAIEDGSEKLDLLKLAYQLFWSDGDYAQEEIDALENMKVSLSENYKLDKLLLDDLIKFRGGMISLENILKRKRV